MHTNLSTQDSRTGGPHRPPNIVVIIVDDMGYNDLGPHTPRLNRMVADGIQLTSFYVTAPMCTPARSALLTGRHQIRTGLIRSLFPDDPRGLSQWEITSPGEHHADQGEVRSVLSAIDYLIAKRAIKDKEERDKPRFGLSSPRLTASFTVRGEISARLLAACSPQMVCDPVFMLNVSPDEHSPNQREGVAVCVSGPETHSHAIPVLVSVLDTMRKKGETITGYS